MSKIRESLMIAISALENDTVNYSWKHVASCNCGVVVRAIFGVNENFVDDLFMNGKQQAKCKDDALTWRNLCQQSCNITGEPLTVVFKQLQNSGLSPKDIVHLEYMNNKAILKESGILTFFPRYYKKKKNLILYLKAWLRILDKNANAERFSAKESLEADLLIASALGNSDEEKTIKNKLSTLK